MKSNWKDFLRFSASERRGVLVLIAITIITALLSYYIPEWISQRQIANFEKRYAIALQKSKEAIALHEIEKREALQQQAMESKRLAEAEKAKTKSVPKVILDINNVSVSQLKSVKIVEDVIAYRIIKFRDNLGGFAHQEQIKEVFEISESDVKAINNTFVFKPKQIAKLDLNKANQEQLQKHPYISAKLASQIVNYRTKVAPFKSKDDVQKLYLMNDELYLKLQPYVTW